ncbi:helix-turn-helix transcriptional regulator [Novosphingobium taihuense]|uniref:DNA-binding CsgD family transcriptional regulator n=1 Tax=Novosphingobium taihuense TaxID=260085 RepID=A0A7W7ESU6_9SPHN|nr:helix-turn-helix transcriptional regulator [Novosphingobium taihuense]MBB4612166.1 DNA-binding CsgD family transcriptional regulator [Novosphingobium taihuense]
MTGELFDNPLGELTAKQREVLDLLIEHKTSKEISRLLGISPHTVDQRIMLARAKLGVATRGEVAQAYRRLMAIYEQPVYEDSHIGFPPLPVASPDRDDVDVGTSAAGFDLPVHDAPAIESTNQAALAGDFFLSGKEDANAYHHVLPEMFDGPNGTLLRLGYIGGITVFLILIVLGGLSMFAQLSTMLDH